MAASATCTSAVENSEGCDSASAREIELAAGFQRDFQGLPVKHRLFRLAKKLSTSESSLVRFIGGKLCQTPAAIRL
jgi:hypothetical protein